MLWNVMKNHLAATQTNPTEMEKKTSFRPLHVQHWVLRWVVHFSPVPFSISSTFPSNSHWCLHKRHLLQSEWWMLYVGSALRYFNLGRFSTRARAAAGLKRWVSDEKSCYHIMQHLMQLMFWLLQLPLTRRIHFPSPLPLTRAAGVVNCSQMGTLCKLIVAHEVGELSCICTMYP